MLNSLLSELKPAAGDGLIWLTSSHEKSGYNDFGRRKSRVRVAAADDRIWVHRINTCVDNHAIMARKTLPQSLKSHQVAAC